MTTKDEGWLHIGQRTFLAGMTATPNTAKFLGIDAREEGLVCQVWQTMKGPMLVLPAIQFENYYHEPHLLQPLALLYW